MNNKAKKLIAEFYNSVLEYIQNEYKPKWSMLYSDEHMVDDMMYITGKYYLGGNTVPFTAGQIVDLLNSKYGTRKSKRKNQ